MIFTSEERRLLNLYHSGSVAETADTLRLAMRYTTDPDERGVIDGLLRKLGGADEAALESFAEEAPAYDG